jgi:plastocyanin
MTKMKYGVIAMLSTIVLVSILAASIFTNDYAVSAQIPNVDASNIYETQKMVLGNNIKNLVILLPDEAHESPALPEEQRFINQPYVPQNAVINTGTTVIWFNADVDHDHKIMLINGQDSNLGISNAVFESRDLPYNTATRSVTFNDTGSFSYIERDVIEDDPNFVMNGTINVVDQPDSLTVTTTNETLLAVVGVASSSSFVAHNLVQI